MKILFICEGIQPEVMGGSQAVIEGLSRALASRGHEITILGASTDSTLPREEIRDGRRKIRRFFLPGKNHWQDALNLAISLRGELSDLLDQQRFDAIFLEHVLSGFLSTLLIPAGVPLYYHFHSPWHREYQIRKEKENGKLNPWDFMLAQAMKFFQKALIRRSQKIVTLSQYMKDQVFKIFPHPDILVIPGGVETGQFFPAASRDWVREGLGIASGQFVIFTARRLTARMGIDLLIGAVQKIHSSYPELRVFISGKGPLENNLKKQMKEARLETVIYFVGHLLHPKFLEYYQAADLFVMPSKELEGFGMATLEALASGTPVLGTKVGGTPEILKAFDSDFLTEPTAEALSQALSHWISRRRELQEWRPKVRAWVENKYAWPLVAAQFEKILRK